MEEGIYDMTGLTPSKIFIEKSDLKDENKADEIWVKFSNIHQMNMKKIQIINIRHHQIRNHQKNLYKKQINVRLWI